MKTIEFTTANVKYCGRSWST